MSIPKEDCAAKGKFKETLGMVNITLGEILTNSIPILMLPLKIDVLRAISWKGIPEEDRALTWKILIVQASPSCYSASK